MLRSCCTRDLAAPPFRRFFFKGSISVISLCVVWLTLRMEFVGELRLENNCRDVFLQDDVLSGLDARLVGGVDVFTPVLDSDFTVVSEFLEWSATDLTCLAVVSAGVGAVGTRRADTGRAVVGTVLVSAKVAGVGANRDTHRRDDGEARFRDRV